MIHYEPFIRLGFPSYPVKTFYSSFLQNYSSKFIGNEFFVNKVWGDYLQERIKEDLPNAKIPKNYFTKRLLEKEVSELAESIIRSAVYEKNGKRYFNSLNLTRFLTKNWEDVFESGF